MEQRITRVCECDSPLNARSKENHTRSQLQTMDCVVKLNEFELSLKRYQNYFTIILLGLCRFWC